ANIETLALTGGGDVDGTGNELANLILGNDGANRLDGRGGADTMRGGGGDDVYAVDEAGDRAVELAGGGRDRVETALDFTLGAGLEDLTLGGAAVAGTGNALANEIIGNGAHNRLDGRAGADRMAGGGGDDLYVVDDAGDAVVESDGEGSDRVEASVSYALGANVEALALVGPDAIEGTGNALANTITGNAAANRLDGAAGADRMIGGAGDDTYLVEAFEDEIIEGASGGIDTVLSSGSYRLAGWVERLVLVGEATDGIGNALDNEIIGNDGINVLDGGDGDDRLVGGGGLDIMKGGDGGDRLDGGGGRDLLTGGAGADHFLFGAPIDGVVNIDDLTDFVAGEDSLHLDRAVFEGIAADGALGEEAFHVGAEAADAGDRLIYNQTSGEIFYDADGTGAAAAILFARVEAGTVLTHLDFAAYSQG
ncbi:MAG TPA: calcium-binding protein, partial [Allosphingosinicella sp.]